MRRGGPDRNMVLNYDRTRRRGSAAFWQAGAPAGGPSSDRPAGQRIPAAGALASVCPAMKEKPGAGWVRPVFSNDPDGFPRHLLGFGMKSGDRQLVQSAGEGAGIQASLPKDLIGHPVADSGKEFLEQ